MENYLEYLEKLQSKMEFSESVDDRKVALYFKLEDVSKRLSTMSAVVLLILEALLLFIAKDVDVVYRNIIAVSMTVVFMFFGSVWIRYAFDSASYHNSVCIERDKVYLANYDVIKNEIVNDGEGQLRQLMLWNDMCELSVKHQKQYKELLQIVRAVCREYKDIYR